MLELSAWANSGSRFFRPNHRSSQSQDTQNRIERVAHDDGQLLELSKVTNRNL